MKSLRSVNLSQKRTVKLNKDSEVIIVRPHEGLMLKYGGKIDKIHQFLNDSNWTSDQKNLDLLAETEEAILTYCVRHPDDWLKCMIVSDDQEPKDYQVRFSEFDPDIDISVLKEQGLSDSDNLNAYNPPKLTLMFLCLRRSGFFAPKSEVQIQEEVDSFPANEDGAEKVAST